MSQNSTPNATPATALTRLSLYRRLSLIGTSITTLLGGLKVGTDDAGNTYYEARKLAKVGRTRRWVMYKGIYDASTVPPEWYGWLHYTQSSPISVEGPYHKNWQQPHEPNLTGSNAAYHPPGAQVSGGKRAQATGDYQPWMPN